MVDHGRPHRSPTANGEYGAAKASDDRHRLARRTCHAVNVNGTTSPYTAGLIRCSNTRSSALLDLLAVVMHCGPP